MQVGMIGLGRMGGNMVRRWVRHGISCVGWARSPASIAELEPEGMIAAGSLADLVARLAAPRTLWLMVPAGAVDGLIEQLLPLLAPGDAIVDGGNSYYRDDVDRAERLAPRGIHYVDVGVSGGVWGLERGYSQMIGGEAEAVRRLDPLFSALAPGRAAAPPTPGRDAAAGTAELGYLHCGPSGAGHFVKMVHNGIEYGIMAAYAEGFNILHHAGIGRKDHAVDAETAPLRQPEYFQYDFPIADVAEVWRRGSVIASWLLDLTAQALAEDPALAGYSGQVADSGEGRWTVLQAVDEGVPAPVIAASLFARFDSRGNALYQHKLLSAMRRAFGGHHERR
jgi:6-phosphogluconate dehydrogenase